jgi:hypothetical protein
LNGFLSGTSGIDFGNPLASRMKAGATTRTFGVNDDFFWSVNLLAIDFSGPGLQYAIKNSAYTAFDSGTSTILVPKKYFKDFIDQIFNATAFSNGHAVPYKVADGKI